MEEINLIIAENIKKIRKSKDLSLEKVAELTGVSKTMIGQIERGESTPTITTLWKIANGLKISFSALIDYPKPDTSVILRSEIQPLLEDNGKYRVYPSFPFDESKRFEGYTVEIDKGGYLDANSHMEGTEELITVFDGELSLRVNDNEYLLKSGDSITFKADKPHVYFNPGHTLTRLSMILYYPS
ncbi:XRE family transcriptional regulator [Paenibacillus sp. G2S3]|uniref:helix-turn-helix domain-containing protein n=1 Tax=Paenibacillus sp. G2S3 TaxID=3047872 RepID=UPI0024C108AE|nr:XRE family transcriptional regulator [Paenibacillus sp. G2S3]WHY17566.1 XRE family transcriptional regulator [Paenibacillus sp. G2S3]